MKSYLSFFVPIWTVYLLLAIWEIRHYVCLFSKVVKNTVIVFTGIKRKSIYFLCKSFFFFLIVSSHMYVCSNQLGSVHNSPVGCVVGFSVFVSFVFLVLQATPKSSYGFVLFQTPSFIILFCVLETFVGLVFLCRVYCCVCQHTASSRPYTSK